MIDPSLLSDVKRVRRQLIDELLAMQEPGGYWTGELSTSALSTATTCVAFNELCKAGVTTAAGQPLRPLIAGGINWLIENVNNDGGWGDTTKSKSNISTTTLCRAAIAGCTANVDQQSQQPPTLHVPSARGEGRATAGNASHRPETLDAVLSKADAWIADAIQGHSSLSAAIVARYGKDKTFSVPILMQCALAGVVDWNEIPRLPFELAVLPHRFYAAVKLPVVSYALPALIAIGQLLHVKNPTWFLPLRFVRSLSLNRTLKKLASLQPDNGGFLEAAPLTGFVTMALAATGRADHVVAAKGAEFLVNSVRDDGSWPIDTNLSTWVTTLVVNALGDSARDELPNADATLRWLLDQQHTEVHPFTNAAPGGWAWTPLPGGVPDADDTAGAIRALMYLRPGKRGTRGEGRVVTSETSAAAPISESAEDAASTSPTVHEVDTAAANGLTWLASLQNRDGGIPTFCKGWGTLPFDRSSCDITAHAISAARAYCAKATDLDATSPISVQDHSSTTGLEVVLEWFATSESRSTWTGRERPECRSRKLVRYLTRQRGSQGEWRPLWFGNQHLKQEENPVYGTARVLIAMSGRGDSCAREFMTASTHADNAVQYLVSLQNANGGLGGGPATPSTIEETAVACEALIYRTNVDGSQVAVTNALHYLVAAIDHGEHRDAQPIGFYFAKLWYYEKLYPYAFALAALQAAIDELDPIARTGE